MQRTHDLLLDFPVSIIVCPCFRSLSIPHGCSNLHRGSRQAEGLRFHRLGWVSHVYISYKTTVISAAYEDLTVSYSTKDQQPKHSTGIILNNYHRKIRPVHKTLTNLAPREFSDFLSYFSQILLVHPYLSSWYVLVELVTTDGGFLPSAVYRPTCCKTCLSSWCPKMYMSTKTSNWNFFTTTILPLYRTILNLRK